MCVYNEPDEIGSVKIKFIPYDGESLQKSKDHSSTKIKQDSFVNGIDKLKYMDETDDEAESASAEDGLLGKSNEKESVPPPSPEHRNSTENTRAKNADDSRGDAEMSLGSTLADGVMSKLNEKLAPIADERTPMLSKAHGEDAKLHS
ncbi:uncharacterized protein LOC121380339 [Gigantopelta aegis]|uniref:uncharacterized protein LOC121380339 n=1 Tax=Gigantopelta aegis TaxID=1735272 RepID=UPI001B887A84|nr:uncharacterized protein LOC121380339 [Gigantopelta aegis]